MKKISLKKRDIKYIIVLIILLAYIVIGFVVGARNSQEYTNHSKNAVSIMATVEASHLQHYEEVHWNMGAGDDIDKEVTIVPYYTYTISYTFEGKEYCCDYNGRSHIGEMTVGKQIEIVIDSTNPEHIITESQTGKADYFFAWMFLSIFLIVLLIWIIRRRKKHK